MKKVILALAMILGASTSYAYDVHVKGHYRANGTYVQPHVRSNPDSTTSNNYGRGYNSGRSSYGSTSSNYYGNSGSSYGNGSSYGSGSSWGSDND